MGPQLVRCGMRTHQKLGTKFDTCFNGAATCSLRNVRVFCLLQFVYVASMGPQLVRCGMRTTAYAGSRWTCSFNGAATCSLRNAMIGLTAAYELFALQWGRNLFVAECIRLSGRSILSGRASMGPQLVRCGMFDSARMMQATNYLLQWGRNLFVAECVRPLGASHRCNGLQWGRNLFVAECTPLSPLRPLRSRASMGPQLVRCGMCGPPYSGRRQCTASMGPQLVRCGMPRPPASQHRTSCCFNGAATCSLRNAPANSTPTEIIATLQWGRNLFVAEWKTLPKNG